MRPGAARWEADASCAMRAGGDSALVPVVDDGVGRVADSEAAAQRRQSDGPCRSWGATGSKLRRGGPHLRWGARATALVGIAVVVAIALLPGGAAVAARDVSDLDGAASGDWARHHERRAEHHQQLDSETDDGSLPPWNLRSFTKEKPQHEEGGEEAHLRAGYTGWTKTWTGSAFEWRWMADGSLVAGSVPDAAQLTEWHVDPSAKDKSDKSEKSDKDDVDFGFTEAEPANSKSSDKSAKSGSDEEEETCEDFPDTILKLPWGVAVRSPHQPSQPPSHSPTALQPRAKPPA